MAEEEQYAHPQVALFTVLFKALSLVVYIFGGLITSSFVVHFVICVVLIALDFWTVKNVSGRILVGLRWWNETDEVGENIWKFESLEQQELERLNKKDGWLFWWSLFLYPAGWTALGIISIVKFNFDYLLISAVALTLGGANIIGFIKCRRDAKKQIQQFASRTVASTLQSAFSV